jgi:hypothetical protein
VRVAVASQPGKTKHFQTVLLPESDEIMLCDCPGLVFPSFVSNTADLIAAGVYPIAHMRDHWPVINLICQRIPREIINALYSIHLPVPTELEMHERSLTELPPPTGEEFLGTLCIARGMLAANSGIPDYTRAARMVIKDYADGKLLYCHPPPNVNDTAMFYRETIATALQNTEKLRNKLLLARQQNEQIETLAKEGESGDSEDVEDNILELLGGTPSETQPGGIKGKGKKWGKKNRKNRNKDTYGCQGTPDDMLKQAAVSSGLVVNAGKYGRKDYTRPTSYSGARGVVVQSQPASGS